VHILVLNVGSSTLKFQLIDTDAASIEKSTDRRLARGQIERVGGEAILTLSAEGRASTKTTAQLRDHAAAVEHVIGWLASDESGTPITKVADIEAVGHRVVHGGERFTHSTRVDDEVWRAPRPVTESA
jgi:acetate kinase